MTKKCLGCGALFQIKDPKKAGFIEKENFDKAVICKRCFRIKNYGDYEVINKNIKDYEKIFDEISKRRDLILFLCDIFTLDESLNYINKLSGKVILVITKKDLLPKSVKEYKLINYIKKNYNLNIVDIIFVSSNKNYNIDLLYNLINKRKVSNNVYLVGNTNAGKSTLINALIKSYGKNDSFITTSSLPATTIDLIEVKLNDGLTLVDTPGLVSPNNYLTNLSLKEVKKILPKVEIKPRTYQMKPNQSLLIGDYARIDYLSDEKNSFTIYLSNNIKVDRINLNTNDILRDLKLTSFNLKRNKDIVINGLLFCKITNDAKVNVYVKDNVKVFERDNLI